MQRHQTKPDGLAENGRVNVIGLQGDAHAARVGLSKHNRVNHHIASKADAPGGYAFAHQVVTRSAFRGVEPVRKLVG